MVKYSINNTLDLGKKIQNSSKLDQIPTNKTQLTLFELHEHFLSQKNIYYK